MTNYLKNLIDDEFLDRMEVNLKLNFMKYNTVDLPYITGTQGWSDALAKTCKETNKDFLYYNFYKSLNWQETDLFDSDLADVLSAKKQCFIMLIGLSGSGKTTLAEEIVTKNKDCNWKVLSSDKIREDDFGDVNDQTHNKEVFELMQNRTLRFLKDGFSVIYDATNLTIKTRKNILIRIQEYKKHNPYLKIKAHVIRTPFLTCLKHNAKRDRWVSNEVIFKQRNQFQIPLYGEGFDQIVLEDFKIINTLHDCTKVFIEKMKNFDQGTHYHDFDLLTHQEKTLEYLYNDETPFEYLKKAALLHDYGKLYTKVKNNKNEYSYYNHANVGTYELLPYVELLNLHNKNDSIKFLQLINYHMIMFDLEQSTIGTIDKYKNLFGEVLYKDLIKLHEADKKASKKL